MEAVEVMTKPWERRQQAKNTQTEQAKPWELRRANAAQQPQPEPEPVQEPEPVGLNQALAAAGSQYLSDAKDAGQDALDLASYVGGRFNKGLLAVPDFPAHLTDGLTWAIEKATGQPAGTYADAYKLADTDLGKAVTASPYPEGEVSKPAKVLGAMAEAGSGGFISKASKISPMADMIMAGGAGLGQLIGGDTGETVGTLGSIPFAIRSAMKNDNPTQKLFGLDEQDGVKIVDHTQKQTGNWVKRKKENAAYHYINENLGAPENLAEILRASYSQGGDAGSMAQRTGSIDLADAEAKNILRNLEGSKVKEAQDAFVPEFVGEAKKDIVGDVDVADTKAIAKQTFNDNEASILADKEARLVEALNAKENATRDLIKNEEGLQNAIDATTVSARASDSSTEAATRYSDIYDENYKGNVKPLYEAGKSTAPMESKNIAEAAKNTYAAMRKDNPEAFDTVAKKIGLDAEIKIFEDGGKLPQELLTVIRRLQSKIDGAYNDSSPTALKGDEIALGSSVVKTLKSAYEDAVPKIKEANAAFEAHANRFPNSSLGKSISKNTPEEFVKGLAATNEKGAKVRKDLKEINDPVLNEAIETNLRAVFTRDYASSEKGAAEFNKKYDDVLDLFPKLRGDLQNASAAKTGLNKSVNQLKIAESAAETAQALKNTSQGSEKAARAKTMLGKFSLKPNETVQSLLKSRDGTDSMAELDAGLKSIGQDGKLKPLLVSELSNNITESSLSPDNVRKFNDTIDGLTSSGVINQTEKDRLIGTVIKAAENKKLITSAQARRAEHSKSGQQEILASMIAGFGAGFFGSGQRLMLTGAFRRETLKMLSGNARNAEVSNMLADPKKYLAAASRDKKLAANAAKNMDDYEKAILKQYHGDTQIPYRAKNFAQKMFAEGLNMTPSEYTVFKKRMLSLSRTSIGLTNAVQAYTNNKSK